MYYASFASIACEGVAEFPALEAMNDWLNHATDIDRYLDKDAAKYDGSKHWDSYLGERKQFTLEQVNELFGGSNFAGQLYQQTEPATGPNVVWHYV